MAQPPLQLLRQNWELLQWDMQMESHELHKVLEYLWMENAHQLLAEFLWINSWWIWGLNQMPPRVTG